VERTTTPLPCANEEKDALQKGEASKQYVSRTRKHPGGGIGMETLTFLRNSLEQVITRLSKAAKIMQGNWGGKTALVSQFGIANTTVVFAMCGDMHS